MFSENEIIRPLAVLQDIIPNENYNFKEKIVE